MRHRRIHGRRELVVDETTIDSRLKFSSSITTHEKAIVEDALRATGGRVFGPSGAAARLGIPRSTLESKIRALKINKNRFAREPQDPLELVAEARACRGRLFEPPASRAAGHLDHDDAVTGTAAAV